MAFCLPKGYRFTGYAIEFSRNLPRFGNGKQIVTNDQYEHGEVSTESVNSFGETNANFDFTDVAGTYKKNFPYGDQKYTISRTGKEDGSDMGNVLYFKLDAGDAGHYEYSFLEGYHWVSDGNTGRAAITLHSVELFFTAEADYSPMTPASSITSPVHAVNIPFQTSKVDYGNISSVTYNGEKRVSYGSANVKDMQANMVLYEEESVEDGTDFDGTTGKVVKFHDGGTITSEDQYFKLGSGDKDVEQIYYIETPTYVELSDPQKTKNPVGYRIVGAQFDYQPLTRVVMEEETKDYQTFSISASRNGTTYYLGADGNETTYYYYRGIWFIDENGFIRLASDPDTYLYHGSNDRAFASTTFDPSTATSTTAYKFSLENGQIVYKPTATAPTMYLRWYRSSGNNHYFRFGTRSNGDWYTPSLADEGSKSITAQIAKTVQDPFTLNVYTPDGSEVKSSSVAGGNVIIVDGYNNDAIKIGVSGKGLVRGTITMQALDPYIDRMSVVCSDKNPQHTDLKVNQTFTASDFSVSGGEFHFYLPDECINDQVQITFEDLWSAYADETYEGGSASHNSRFSYVKSAHYNAFGASNNNIYNDIDEAKSATPLERQKVETVGNRPFRFSNTSEFTGSNPDAEGYIKEYPFSLENYADDPNNGSFNNLTFTVKEEDQTATVYVFTTDETRYNISKATATQHRAYAYYKMIVHVQSATYTPQVEMRKIYKNTYYDEGTTKGVDKPFYGAIITAPDGEGRPGFASDVEVINVIQDAITAKKDSKNNDISDLKGTDQILYVDMSGLGGFYENSQYGMDTYKNSSLAKNALVFLPKGFSYDKDNFAYKMETGNLYRSANNIVLVDKQPFFSPYEIQVGDAYYATYTRQITNDDNGQVQNATVILPFTLRLENGLHTNSDGKCSFYVNKMVDGATMSLQDGSSIDHGTAFFEKLTDELTEANKPYMIKVEKTENTDEAGNGISFVATQYGSNIIPTPATGYESTIGTGMLHDGETATAYFNSATYTMTNKASFSGAKFDRAKSEDVYYFANNQYLDLHTLARSAGQYLKSYPFRGVYTYTRTGGTEGTYSKLMKWFDISYDTPNFFEVPTSLDEQTAEADLMVRAGNGVVTLSATRSQDVTINTLSGMSVKRIALEAGDTQTVSLPSGIYVINNVKIIVK